MLMRRGKNMISMSAMLVTMRLLLLLLITLGMIMLDLVDDAYRSEVVDSGITASPHDIETERRFSPHHWYIRVA